MISAFGSFLKGKNLGSCLFILNANKSVTGLILKLFEISLKTCSFGFHSGFVSLCLCFAFV